MTRMNSRRGHRRSGRASATDINITPSHKGSESRSPTSRLLPIATNSGAVPRING